MSFRPCPEPAAQQEAALKLVLHGRRRTIAGLQVRRLLPAGKQRMVGPFVYFDHMGPHDLTDAAPDMPQHPHINLAAVTYLFDGAFVHRDSTGATQTIRPGEINWMTAGKGIVHSERHPRNEGIESIHGLQVWLALPEEAEEVEPFFVHHPAESFPPVDVNGVQVRTLLGDAFGKTSPVRTHSPTLYVEIEMPEKASLDIPALYQEQALYVVQGRVEAAGVEAGPGTMLVMHEGQKLSVVSSEPTLAVLIGGDRLGERHIWWNFVSRRRDRIEEAANQWTRGEFEMVHGDVEDALPMPPFSRRE